MIPNFWLTVYVANGFPTRHTFVVKAQVPLITMQIRRRTRKARFVDERTRFRCAIHSKIIRRQNRIDPKSKFFIEIGKVRRYARVRSHSSHGLWSTVLLTGRTMEKLCGARDRPSRRDCMPIHYEVRQILVG